jgi:Mrp family chromosome partitioning ATPase
MLAVLAGRWREGAWAAGLALVAAALVVAVGGSGRMYAAPAEVLVKLPACEIEAGSRGQGTSADLLEQVDLVRSEHVARQVFGVVPAPAGGATASPATEGTPWVPAPRDERLAVSVWGDRCMLTLTYSDADPQVAAAVANAYANAYVRAQAALAARAAADTFAEDAGLGAGVGLTTTEAMVVANDLASYEATARADSVMSDEQFARRARLRHALEQHALEAARSGRLQRSLPLAATLYQPAVPPPLAPRGTGWHTALVFMASLVAGLALPLWRESRVPLLRVEDDVTSTLEQRLLGRVPFDAKGKGLRDHAVPLSLENDSPGIATQPDVCARSIGSLLRERCGLDDDQIAVIRSHQEAHRMLFGEAARALGLVQAADLAAALADQRRDAALLDPAKAPSAPARRGDVPAQDGLAVFRDLHARLMESVPRPDSGYDVGRAIAVVSPDQGDGRSYVTANLAVAASQMGLRTLLVDADLRAPSQHEAFGLEMAKGLASLLRGNLEHDLLRPVPGVPGLRVLTAGATLRHSMPLLRREVLRQFVRAAAKHFDIVLVDTPSGLAGPEAIEVARHCDAVVAVGRRGKTSIASMDALLQLAGSPTRVAGVVMNAA